MFLICIFNTFIKQTVLNFEEFEDTKGKIRIRKWKKDTQHNGQSKMDKRTNNDLQKNKQNTKDGVARIPLKSDGEGRCPER